MLDTLDKIYGGKETGTRGYGKNSYGNIGAKTLKAFNGFGNAKEEAPDLTTDYETEETKVGSGPTTPEEQEKDTSQDTTVEEPDEASLKDRYSQGLTGLRKNENQLRNTLASFSDIEGVDKESLNLQRYAYEDNSAMAREEVRRQGTVGRYNVGNTYGSRGQQLSYLTQNDAAQTRALNQINAGEVDKKETINRANVDLTNTERQFGVQENLRAADILRRQRSARTKFGQAASQERTQMAYMDEQAAYMKSRDARLQDTNELLANVLATNNFRYSQLYKDNRLNKNAQQELKI